MKNAEEKNKIKLEIKFFLERVQILEMCKIHKIKITVTNKVIVYLERPGIIIGRGGRIIRSLQREIKMKIEIKEYNPFRDK